MQVSDQSPDAAREPECWFVRHGQSTANAGLPTLAPACTEITPLGRVQAADVARRLPPHTRRIVVSAYVRTLQTAAPALQRFGLAAETWPVHEFTYLPPERFAGTTTLQRLPQVEAYWRRCDPHHREGPGAETFAEMTARLDDTLRRLETLPGPSVVYSHGQFLRAVLWRLLDPANAGEPGPDAMARFLGWRQGVVIPNGAILRIRFAQAGPWIGGILTDHLAPELRTP